MEHPLRKKYARENFLNQFMNGDTPEYDLSSGDFQLLFKTTKKPRLYQLDKYEAGRPDLLAYKIYQNTQLWWILMKYNDIIDPFSELVEGFVLKVPDLKDIQTFQRESKKLKSRQAKLKKDF